MRIALALVGSRGDVQPGLAVALELRRRGHEVATGVAPNLLPLAERLGLDPVPVGVDSGGVLRSDLVRRRLRSRRPDRRVRAMGELLSHGWDELRRDLAPLADGADVVVTGLLGQQVGSAVAEREDCGFAALHYCPVRPNTSAGVPVSSPLAQRAFWRLADETRWRLTRRAETAQRAALGLPPPVVGLPARLRDRGAIEIQAYDPVLFPGLAEEWGPRLPLTGFLSLGDEDRAALGEAGVDDDIGEWLDAGEPPVYVGFGSMPVADPEALLATITDATADLGLRVLVSAGWNDVSPRRDERVAVVGAVDHATVLGRCAALVHHGGAGTVGAGLRAGVPAVVAWWSADQPHWGALLTRTGVGARLRAATLDRAGLRDALARVTRPEVVRRARELASRMIGPDVAVRAAADAVEMAG